MRQLNFSSPRFLANLEEFSRRSRASPACEETVRSILKDVKEHGDRAVLKYTAQFDGAELKPRELRVDPENLAEADRVFSAKDREAVKEAVRCVRDFHRRGTPVSWKGRNPQGARVGEIYYSLDRVGIYVPGGNVPLLSTALMTIPLAKLAGVPEIAVFTPPQPDGSIKKTLLGVFQMCGANEIYRIGGVQAVGAMAYGTATVPGVTKIFGPGNAFVTEAKRQVFGEVGIDLLPGPSEVMIIADAAARPEYIAADLLAQAEHGLGGSVFLVTSSPRLAGRVKGQIKSQMAALKERKFVQPVMEKGFLIILVRNFEEAITVANRVAPEHLELQVGGKHIRKLLCGIRNAGAILIGEDTPTVLGDFTAGPSHTLPTGGTARFRGGLKQSDFYRRSSLVEYNRPSLARARPVVEALSRLENLEAHGRSLEVRFKD